MQLSKTQKGIIGLLAVAAAGYSYIPSVCSKAGEQIRCHEFHYSDTDHQGDGFTAAKSSGKCWQAVVASDTIFAGYPHLHLWSNRRFAENFVRKCGEFGGRLWR